MFTKDYWLSSWRKLKSVKYLAIMGMMIAMKVILNNIRIPVSDNLNIMFSYIPAAMEGMIIGPAAAMVSGLITDLLGVMISNYGPFFPGYTISKVLGGLIYGLFFYLAKPSLARIAGCKAVINYVVNVGLGSLWSAMMMGKAYMYYFSTSIVKNTILLPIEIAILFLVFRFLCPILKRKGIISDS